MYLLSYTGSVGNKEITITANIPKKNPNTAHSSLFLRLDSAAL